MAARFFLRAQVPYLLFALFLPLVARLLPWPLWLCLSPYVWFLFYPAVFFGARVGGLWGGFGSTLLSGKFSIIP